MEKREVSGLSLEVVFHSEVSEKAMSKRVMSNAVNKRRWHFGSVIGSVVIEPEHDPGI